MKTIEYGSVCSGIEAATVAWDLFGWRPTWFAEIEPFPSAVLAHHYPKVANLGDMTQIAMLIRAGLVGAPDVLVGGTPCQAFSVAGVRGGLTDPRGQLTLSFGDLANAIDERRPGDECVIYWENVPGVLSSRDNAFGCFLALLAGELDVMTPEPQPAPGKNSTYWKWDKNENEFTCRWPNAGCVYGPQRAVAWRVLDAQYFGVAQRRRRVFVVASARKGFDPAKLLFEPDGVRRDSPPRRETGQEITGTLTARFGQNGGAANDDVDSGRLIAYGRNNCSGVIDTSNALTTKIRDDFETETFIVSGNVQAVTVDVCPTLRAGGNETGGHRPPGTDVDTADSLIVSAPYETTPTLTSNDDAHSGFRDEHGLSIQCVTGDITHTLKVVGFDASEDGTGRGQPIVAFTASIVRRLTPRECERLQGFPDDYTLVPVKGKPAADGPRYKALGNSMAVPCMRWLAMRLIVTHPQYLL